MSRQQVWIKQNWMPNLAAQIKSFHAQPIQILGISQFFSLQKDKTFQIFAKTFKQNFKSRIPQSSLREILGEIFNISAFAYEELLMSILAKKPQILYNIVIWLLASLNTLNGELQLMQTQQLESTKKQASLSKQQIKNSQSQTCFEDSYQIFQPFHQKINKFEAQINRLEAQFLKQAQQHRRTQQKYQTLKILIKQTKQQCRCRQDRLKKKVDDISKDYNQLLLRHQSICQSMQYNNSIFKKEIQESQSMLQITLDQQKNALSLFLSFQDSINKDRRPEERIDFESLSQVIRVYQPSGFSDKSTIQSIIEKLTQSYISKSKSFTMKSKQNSRMESNSSMDKDFTLDQYNQERYVMRNIHEQSTFIKEAPGQDNNVSNQTYQALRRDYSLDKQANYYSRE